MTFTKEQLQHIIETDHVQCGDASALARMALAGMEAEPVVESKTYGPYVPKFIGPAVWAAITDELPSELVDKTVWISLSPQPLTTSERAELENYRNAQQVVPGEKVIGTFNAEKNELALLDKNMTVERFAHWHAHNSLEVIVRPGRAAMQSGAVKDGWVACSERMPPLKTGVIVGKWMGRSWATKWATYIPSHPEANSHGYIMPGGSWCPTHWQPLPAAPQQEAE